MNKKAIFVTGVLLGGVAANTAIFAKQKIKPRPTRTARAVTAAAPADDLVDAPVSGSARLDLADGSFATDGDLVQLRASLSYYDAAPGPLTWSVEMRPEVPDQDDECPVLWSMVYDTQTFTPPAGTSPNTYTFAEDLPVEILGVPSGTPVWFRIAVRDARGNDVASVAAPVTLP